MSVVFISEGGLLSNQYGGSPYSSNPREIYEFEFQVQAENTYQVAPYVGLAVNYKIQSGQLPLDLSLDTSSGLISGTVVELDTWVSSYERAEDYKIAIDGSNYASYGSDLSGSYESFFVVRAYIVGYESTEYTDQSCSILVVNNYSSSRDSMIREYSSEYGNTFIVNDEIVDANTFLSYQKSIGNYPEL